MSHLDEGTLQAFLDQELSPRARADAAEHMLGCAPCRAAHGELSGAKTLFSEAVALLDVEPPRGADAPPTPARHRWGMGAWVKAAGLVLFLAAAASAAVPGSPVRALIERAAETRPAAPAPAPAPAGAPVREAVPAGISVLPRGGGIEVDIAGMQGAVIRLQEGSAEGVSVSSRGAETDPAFRSGPGRIGVRGGVGGEVLVELPPALSRGRLVVDGRVYADIVDGELRIRHPGETIDGGVVWR